MVTQRRRRQQQPLALAWTSTMQCLAMFVEHGVVEHGAQDSDMPSQLQ